MKKLKPLNTLLITLLSIALIISGLIAINPYILYPGISPSTMSIVYPHINQARHMNNESLQRAKLEIKYIFNQMEQNVPVFVDDLYSLSTKGRIIYNAGLDYFSDDSDNLNALVLDKFEEHIISSDELNIQINAIIQDLIHNLSSNTDTMLSNIQMDMAITNTPIIEIQGLDEAIHSQVVDNLKGQLAWSVGGEATAFVLEVIIAHLIIQSTARAGIATLTAAGSLGIGLIVAVITDMVISHYAKEHMTEKVLMLMQEMRITVLEGDNQAPGIYKQLEDFVDSYSDEMEKSVLTAIAHSGR